METKVSDAKKTNLPELPPNDDAEFWLDAEIHGNIDALTKEMAVVAMKAELSKHYFVRTTGRQAQCEHCGWGFELDPGDKIENGHLYDKQGKLVI
jgi:hypothetical protein